MAKKFGKLLFLAAAAGAVAAAVHYYLQKKNAEETESEEEDYDDFSDDSQAYVPLPFNTKAEEANEEAKKDASCSAAASPDEGASPDKNASPGTDGFTPLKDAVEHIAGTANETPDNVEDFFDEEDVPDEEPAITDH